MLNRGRLNIGKLNPGALLTRRAPSFSLTDLFANGESGALYTPWDLSTMWQDAAGTTAAAVDSPVGRIDDQSGNGNNATQSTSSKRPILRQSGSLYYLEFDGVDDVLSTGSKITIGQSHSMFAAANIRSLSVNTNASLFSGQDTLDGTNRYAMDIYNNSGTCRLRSTYPSIDSFNTGLIIDTSTPFKSVFSQHRDSGVDLLQKEAPGNENTIGTASADFTEPNFLVIGRHRNTAQFASIDWYGGLVRGARCTAAEIEAVNVILAAKAGVTL